jgi:hypothetical protein
VFCCLLQSPREHFQNLESFLDAYRTGLTALMTEQDFHELAAAYLESAAANNITHAEIFFDIQNHLKRYMMLAAGCTKGSCSGFYRETLAVEHARLLLHQRPFPPPR